MENYMITSFEATRFNLDTSTFYLKCISFTKTLAYLAPKRRVERLSDAFEGLGEQQQSNAVCEFPPCILHSKFVQISNWKH